jgi:quercetin dioxygenase-like cupin family protein
LLIYPGGEFKSVNRVFWKRIMRGCNGVKEENMNLSCSLNGIVKGDRNMTTIIHIDSHVESWRTVSEGVEMLVLRAEPGENRVLLRLAPGKGYPRHKHTVAEEVFILEGTYVDPDFDKEKEYGSGSYLYYSPGSDHYATSPTGCTFLVMNAKNSEK